MRRRHPSRRRRRRRRGRARIRCAPISSTRAAPRVMLEAARQEGIRHVVYGSTIWVYGNVPGGGALDEESCSRRPSTSTPRPSSPARRTAASYGRMFGLAPTILRFGIPHGPRARPTTVVARFVARALAGESLSINGDGNQTRQFVYVEDLAEGVVASLTDGAPGPHLQPRRRRDRERAARLRRSCASSSATSRSCTSRAASADLGCRRHLRPARLGRARVAAFDGVRRRRCALRRVARRDERLAERLDRRR